MAQRRGLLERLAAGPVIGDGSFVVTLERRGYVEAGAWTPEAVVQYPEAGTRVGYFCYLAFKSYSYDNRFFRQLHRDYLRAGADVMQTFTFYSTDEKLQFSGDHEGVKETVNCDNLNRAACDIARDVAGEGDALVAGGLSPVPGFTANKGKTHVMKEFQKQLNVFREKDVDFLLGEFFGHIEEAEWSIEAMRQLELPVACSMRIGPAGDLDGVTPEECALRLANAGADVVGVNCNYDPFICLETVHRMKVALDEAGISCHLMIQPVGWHTYEIRDDERGYMALPEFPFAMEPRLLTRVDVAKFAREAYNIGIRYIGGCCGFEPYHIRAIAEELAEERGFRPPGHDKHGGFESLKKSVLDGQSERAHRDYWEKLIPATGRKDGKILAEVPKKCPQEVIAERL